MSAMHRSDSHSRLIASLTNHFSGSETCTEVIDRFDLLMHWTWKFLSRVLGNGGTKAVLARSVHLATLEFPLLLTIRVSDSEIDLVGIRNHFNEVDCTVIEVVDAFVSVSEKMFQILTDFTGDLLTEPLLQHLGGSPEE